MSNQRLKVLLVDDDALLRELLGLIVEKHGYLLSKADNGRAAIEMITSFQPDLIVLDVMMPVMDGREFLAWFSAQPGEKAKVLVLTSMTESKLHKDLYALGATKVATKPISMKVLESEIDSLLGKQTIHLQVNKEG